jgi:hypothetical protein
VRRLRAKAWLVALLAVAACGATFQGGGGYEQNSHYALVRALGDGGLRINTALTQIGSLKTGDVVRNHGHIYSNKPPGMAFVALPAYLVLRAVGVDTVSDPSRTLWFIGLAGVVLPFFVLLLLVRWVTERIEPGWGTVTAVVLGLGTTLLPFAQLFYAHTLAAALLFGCFALLFRERHGEASLVFVALAGACAGYAFGTEIQSAAIALVLGVYALVRRPILSRGLAFTAGGIVGALPFLVYTWAIWGRLTFGWVGRADGLGLHYGLTHVHIHKVHRNGLAWPDPHSAWMVLLSSRGIFVVTPVLVCALVGLVLLVRSQLRAEGIVCLCAVGIPIVLDAGYYPESITAPFGGLKIASRYLIPTFPFLAVGLAKAFRRWPYATLGLSAVSVAIMSAVTMTYPESGFDGRWLRRLGEGSITPLGWAGVPDWRAAVPFVVFVAIALGATWLTVPREAPATRQLVTGAVVLAAWAVYALVVHTPWPTLKSRMVNGFDAFAVAALCCAALLALAALYTRRARTAT